MFNKKILCLGNNGKNTDEAVSLLSKTDETVNHGLVVDEFFIPSINGYYHTSVMDISFGGILRLAEHFDKIIFLDQSQSEWSHWKPMLSTYKIMVELDAIGYDTEYKNNENIKSFIKFEELLENKSFCIYPWINSIEEYGHMTLCARSEKKVTLYKDIGNWKTNPEYSRIRAAMLKGEQLPDYCKYCYDYESRGIESYRQFETKEWISKLDIQTIEDLDKIEHPYYYEVRLSNKCNIKCRSCKPEYSHLIDKEFKKFNIIHPSVQTFQYSSIDRVEIPTLSPKTRVYLTGGEPTIIAEVLEFMERCIAAGKTDFDFNLGSNGVKLSQRFLDLSSHFTNLSFSISLDGYGKINDYWRSGSDWDTIISNTKMLQARGDNISINCVPGIYNVTNLHLLFEFLDREFPHTGIYLQINHVGMQSAYNHPNPKLVVESMERCKQTKMYYTDGKSNKTAIDSLYDYYSKNPICDLKLLKDFFDYNDKLDNARNIKLIDYIPELEECRKLIM